MSVGQFEAADAQPRTIPAIALTMQGWRSVSWPQRVLLVGVIATVLACATRAAPPALTTAATPSVLLWATFAVNALLLLVLGPIALATTRRWFQQALQLERPRRQRRVVRRRAVLLGLMAYVGHQTLVVLLDPRFSLERLTGRRRVFGPVVTVPDRLELAWAFTAVAIGYILLAWLLWRTTSSPHVVPGDVVVARPTAILESPPPLPLTAAPAPVVEALPRDPRTGRVIRQFDVSG